LLFDNVCYLNGHCCVNSRSKSRALSRVTQSVDFAVALSRVTQSVDFAVALSRVTQSVDFAVAFYLKEVVIFGAWIL
jgi:hypothetical protein